MAEFDPRRFDDLSAVITLCATAPRSPEFDSTWRQWLETNPAADLDGAIATVISRAETIRSMAVSGMEVRRSGHRFSAAEIAEHMQQLGRRTRADVASSKDSSSKITVIASGSSQH